MFNVLINPENYDDKYLQCLNESFQPWGEVELFNWVFKRQSGGLKPDMIVLQDEKGEDASGSGISYRVIKNAKGTKLTIGIMTGSWTLPNARGKGGFTKIIEESKKLCLARGARYLTAFVMESNKSFDRLKAAGAKGCKTYTLLSKSLGQKDISIDVENMEIVEDISILKEKIQFNPDGDDKFYFEYSSDEFENQFINRPSAIKLFKIDANYIILEEAYNVFKVIGLSYNTLDKLKQIINRVQHWVKENYNKGVLYFTTDPKEAELLGALNFETYPGYFMAISIGEYPEEPDFLNNLSIRVGDKM